MGYFIEGKTATRCSIITIVRSILDPRRGGRLALGGWRAVSSWRACADRCASSHGHAQVLTCVFGGLSIPIGTPSVTMIGLALCIASTLFVAMKVSISAVLMKDAR